jgi:hypothetical protein
MWQWNDLFAPFIGLLLKCLYGAECKKEDVAQLFLSSFRLAKSCLTQRDMIIMVLLQLLFDFLLLFHHETMLDYKITQQIFFRF